MTTITLTDSPLLIDAQSIPSPDPTVQLFHITYWSGTLRVKGYVARPSHETSHCDRLPAVVYCRGGIGRIGMVKIDWMIRFVRQGFAVVAPSYRGNEGGEGREDFNLDDREDAFAAIRLTRTLAFVNPARVTVYGFSRGGPLALFAGMDTRLGVHSVIAHGGVADLAMTYEQRVDLRRMLKRVVGGTPTRYPQAYAQRSPIHVISHIRVPLLIIHGFQDVQVDVSHAFLLSRSLQQARTHHETWYLPRAGHHLDARSFDRLIAYMYTWTANI